MDEIKREIKEAIEKHLPTQVGKVLSERLKECELNELKVKDAEKKEIKLNKIIEKGDEEIAALRAVVNKFDNLNNKEIELGNRESVIKEQENIIKSREAVLLAKEQMCVQNRADNLAVVKAVFTEKKLVHTINKTWSKNKDVMTPNTDGYSDRNTLNENATETITEEEA